MAYVDPDYPTKKAFIEAVKAKVQHKTYYPTGMFLTKQNGPDVVEGPHYPKPNWWYASVEVENGNVVSAK
jgi:hypothetical protein